MAIAVVETLTNTSGNNSSLTINTGDFTPNPGVGDLLVSHFVYGSTGATITLPSGWTQIIKTENAGDAITSQLAYKVADSSDASGQSLTWDKGAGNVVIKIFVTRITGQKTVSVIAASSGQANDSTTTVTAPTVTPSDADSLIMFFTATDGSGSISGYSLATSSPTFTEQYDSTANNYGASMAYGIRPEVTATGSGTATDTDTGNNIGQLVVVSSPQSATLTDTVTATDETRYNIGGLYTDSISLSESNTFTEKSWFNQDKNNSTWDNQEKSE